MITRKRNVLAWVGVLLVLYAVSMLLPLAPQPFYLGLDIFVEGEFLRFLTHQFSHADINHLVENIVGLSLLGLLVFEVQVNSDRMFFTYALTGFLAALPLWFFLRSNILGASVAIYGGFGIIILESKKFEMNPLYGIGIIFLSLIIKPLLSGFAFTTVKQGLFHLSGFIGGMILYKVVSLLADIYSRSKTQILQGEST